MGVLDGGIAAVFGAAFGALYLDGQIVTALTDQIYDDGGNITGYGGGDPVPCKCQIDGATWAMQQANGYVDGDVRIIVLSAGLGIELTTDHRIEVGDETWMIASVERDAARSHFICRGRKA